MEAAEATLENTIELISALESQVVSKDAEVAARVAQADRTERCVKIARVGASLMLRTICEPVP